MSVVMPDEVDQDALELAPVEDQKTIEALSADGPYEPLGERIRTGRPDGSAKSLPRPNVTPIRCDQLWLMRSSRSLPEELDDPRGRALLRPALPQHSDAIFWTTRSIGGPRRPVVHTTRPQRASWWGE
jgi:hypothetical protein